MFRISLVSFFSCGRDLSKNKLKSHFYSNGGIYLPGTLKGCKLQWFNRDSIILANLAQLSHVARVQLMETDMEVKA